MSNRRTKAKTEEPANPAHADRLKESEAYHAKKEEVTIVSKTREVHYDSRGKPKTVEKTKLSNGNVHSTWIGPGDLTKA